MPVDYGKSTRAAVQALINAMNNYHECVSSELKTLLKRTNELGDVWEDPQYDTFANFMTESIVGLNKDLTIFKEASVRLQRKLDMYDE